MKTIISLSLALVVGALGGCSANGEPEPLPAPPVDPENVPTRFTLSSPVPVLVATFEASESGYEVDLSLAQGVPSSIIDQNRDVVIRALDANGETLSSVSVFNPRDIHTAGSRDPDRAVRASGSFTVAFARPEAEVVRGANEGLERSIPVDPKQVRPRDPYGGQKED
jgi:hypothetical protein